MLNLRAHFGFSATRGRIMESGSVSRIARCVFVNKDCLGKERKGSIVHSCLMTIFDNRPLFPTPPPVIQASRFRVFELRQDSI